MCLSYSPLHDFSVQSALLNRHFGEPQEHGYAVAAIGAGPDYHWVVWHACMYGHLHPAARHRVLSLSLRWFRPTHASPLMCGCRDDFDARFSAFQSKLAAVSPPEDGLAKEFAALVRACVGI